MTKITKHPLAQYKNLTDWAIRAHRDDAHEKTLASMKSDLLHRTNTRLYLGYKITSMNQWLAGTRAVPRRIQQMWMFDPIRS